MHKWAKQIMECVKAKVDGIGIENFEGQNLDDLKGFYRDSEEHSLL